MAEPSNLHKFKFQSTAEKSTGIVSKQSAQCQTHLYVYPALVLNFISCVYTN